MKITKDVFNVIDGAIMPTIATDKSVGFDLYATDDGELYQGTSAILGTGVSLNMPDGYYAMVCSRSGLAAKSQTFVLNAPGIIDADYKDELKVIIFNAGYRPFIWKKGDRIAQLVFVEMPVIAEELLPSESRVGGLGSTGK